MGDIIYVYPRTDGKYEWRRVAGNNRVVSTSGSQGYETEAGAYEAAQREANVPVDDIRILTHDAIRSVDATDPGLRAAALPDMVLPDPIDPDGASVGD